jgi:putative ATPase
MNDKPRNPGELSPSRLTLPLAEQLRPGTIDQVLGQSHLLGPGRPIRAALDAGRLHSMILWGPPGSGKTTLARLLAAASGAQLISISAVLGGVKEIREAVDTAERCQQMAQTRGQAAVVFVDEVHRFNKAQQDAFLPHVESGLFVFIGATTENPAFEVNRALLSRATVHVLRPLDAPSMVQLRDRALDSLGQSSRLIADSAWERLVTYADGDARRLLGAIELLVPQAVAHSVLVDDSLLDHMLPQMMRQFDKGGDAFYDQISALHKSVRGSDPDAALYWFVRMIDGGCDPRYIGRRMVRMAVEDIGLADPRALTMALESCEAYERLGSPEGELALAQALVFMACAAKSNAVYAAVKAARRFVEERPSMPVPDHLRNAPTGLARAMGHGRDYRYSHDEAGGFSPGQTYFPDQLGQPPRFYEPVDRGMESKIASKLTELRRLQQEALRK